MRSSACSSPASVTWSDSGWRSINDCLKSGRKVVIVQQPHKGESDTNLSSRSSAKASHALMSSTVKSGKSTRISSSHIPDARYSSTSYTVILKPRMHGLPPRLVRFNSDDVAVVLRHDRRLSLQCPANRTNPSKTSLWCTGRCLGLYASLRRSNPSSCIPYDQLILSCPWSGPPPPSLTVRLPRMYRQGHSIAVHTRCTAWR